MSRAGMRAGASGATPRISPSSISIAGSAKRSGKTATDVMGGDALRAIRLSPTHITPTSGPTRSPARSTAITAASASWSWTQKKASGGSAAARASTAAAVAARLVKSSAMTTGPPSPNAARKAAEAVDDVRHVRLDRQQRRSAVPGPAKMIGRETADPGMVVVDPERARLVERATDCHERRGALLERGHERIVEQWVDEDRPVDPALGEQRPDEVPAGVARRLAQERVQQERLPRQRDLQRERNGATCRERFRGWARRVRESRRGGEHRWRVRSWTRRFPEKTCETVVIETPAASATSKMVVLPFSFGLIKPSISPE